MAIASRSGVRTHVYERCRAGIERLVLDGEADTPAHDEVHLLVTVRLAVALDHGRSDRSGPAVDAERAHLEPSPQWDQHRSPAHRRIALTLVENNNGVLANAHDS
jgi:hypothetical protein